MLPTFIKLIESSNKIDFNPNWIESARLLTHAVQGIHAPKLRIGETVTTNDVYGRSIVLIGTGNFTNIIIFQQNFSIKNKSNNTIISNESFEFHEAVKDTTGIELNNPLCELDMLAICETITKSMPFNKKQPKGTFLKH